MNKVDIVEHGVHLQLEHSTSFISKKTLYKLNSLELSRSVALTSLVSLCNESKEKIRVLDAFGGLGMASLQWTTALDSSRIEVDINVKENVKNALLLRDEAKDSCPLSGCNIMSGDINVIMHSNKYSFIYLQCLGSVVQYLDAAFRATLDGGLLIVTTCDIPVLMNRAPDTTFRVYGAKLHKTEYLLEMSIRTVIANMVNAASRQNKALDVKGFAIAEEGLTVVCQVKSSCKLAEASTRLLRFLAHCQQCGSHKFLNRGKFITNFVNHKVCSCTEQNNLNPVLILGPMYAGRIMDAGFLYKLKLCSISFSFKPSILKYYDNVLLETMCFDTDEQAAIFANSLATLKSHDHSFSCMELITKAAADSWKLQVDKMAFFFDVQEHSFSGNNPPRWDVVVSHLRAKNFRACRSIFGARCVRTSANMEQIEQVLNSL